MKKLVIGVQIVGPTASALLDDIEAAERAGINVAWLTSGGVAPDPLVVFGAAAARTSSIEFGTSIIPTFPRHPLALAQGAIAVDQLAPGRLRLGIGPSHRPMIESSLGIAFERPLQHLREYVTILKALFTDGKVSFSGDRLRAEAQLQRPADVRVMVSALRGNAFRLAGELADGGISWVCPMPYLRDVAAPAIRQGAAKVDRTQPPLVAHVPVVVSEDRDAVRAAARKQLAIYPRLPFYSQMFQDAGFPEAAGGVFSEAMSDALVISGSPQQVAERLRALPGFGAEEIIATVVTPDGDSGARARTMAVLGEIARGAA